MHDTPTPHRPVVLPWDDAHTAVLDAAEPTRRRDGVAIIGVTGPVGAGKSTLASRLSPIVISTDRYLPDYDRVPYDQRDRPEHSDLPLLARHLRDIRAGRSPALPRWSFHTHRREGDDVLDIARVRAAGILVVEGIHALAPAVAADLDLRLYVEAPPDVRWARWDVLERAGVRGWGPEDARRYFDRVAEPTFQQHANLYAASAHFLIRNDRGVPSVEAFQRA